MATKKGKTTKHKIPSSYWGGLGTGTWAEGCGGREEHGAEAGAEDDAQSHGEGAAPGQELVTGGAGRHRGQAAHHPSRVPGSPRQDRAPCAQEEKTLRA